MTRTWGLGTGDLGTGLKYLNDNKTMAEKKKRKVTIKTVTRVEGHGRVTVHLDERGEVEDARFHIVEFRGALCVL